MFLCQLIFSKLTNKLIVSALQMHEKFTNKNRMKLV